MDILPTDTANEVRGQGARIAVLPVGSFEQHGDHLPVTTDTLIAGLIAKRIAEAYNLWLLPPVAFGCSHEHASLGATVSIRAATLYAVVTDIAASLRNASVRSLVVVNGHGGNYVLSNVVQEANESQPQLALYPSRSDWDAARAAAGMTTSTSEDMHAGEMETSLLLHAMPELVDRSFPTADHEAPDRPLLLTIGVEGYAPDGVIGTPSAATAAKGESALKTLTSRFSSVVDVLKALP
ncbi:MAG: creatininase family protein [Dermatophilaceae bacterium]